MAAYRVSVIGTVLATIALVLPLGILTSRKSEHVSTESDLLLETLQDRLQGPFYSPHPKVKIELPYVLDGSYQLSLGRHAGARTAWVAASDEYGTPAYISLTQGERLLQKFSLGLQYVPFADRANQPESGLHVIDLTADGDQEIFVAAHSEKGSSFGGNVLHVLHERDGRYVPVLGSGAEGLEWWYGLGAVYRDTHAKVPTLYVAANFPNPKEFDLAAYLDVGLWKKQTYQWNGDRFVKTYETTLKPKPLDREEAVRELGLAGKRYELVYETPVGAFPDFIRRSI